MIHRIFAALFLSSSLVILTNLPFPYSLPRWTFLTLLSAAWSLFLIRDVIKKIIAPITRLDCTFIFFVLVLAASTIFSIDPLRSMWGSLERSFAFSLWPVLLVCYFGLKQAFLKQDNKTFLFRFFTITVAAAALWGIFQKNIPGFSATFSGNRIGGTLGNAIFFGSYLTLSIGIIATRFFDEKKYSQWWFFSATSIALASVSLFFTQTRGPLLGLFVGIAVAIATYFFVTKPYKKTILIIFASVCALAVATAFFTFNKKIVTPTTITTRLYNWDMAWHGIADRPIFGWGPENFNIAADKYFEPKLAEYSIAETHADKPHNYFIEIAVTSGLVGLLTYLFLLTSAFDAVRAVRASHQFAILLGTLVASAVQNASSFETHGSIVVFVFLLAYLSSQQTPINTKKLQLPLFLTLALCVFFVSTKAALPIVKDAPHLLAVIKLTQPYRNEHTSIRELQKNLSSTAFPLDYFTALSHAIVGQYWQNPTGYAALTENEQELHLADVAWLRSVISELNDKHPTSGPWKSALANSTYQLFSLTKNVNDAVAAEKIFTEYSELSPRRQEPLLQRGQLALLQNNPEKALPFFDAAIALNPDFATPHWQKTLTLFVLKKHTDAWKELSYLMSTGFEVKPPQVANYIYNELLGNSMQQEAETFRSYFEAGNF